VKKPNRYALIIEKIFLSKYKSGAKEVPFERDDITRFAAKLRVALPKNLGDVVYSFRYRAQLPERIQSLAGENETWIIRPAGPGKYAFVLVPDLPLEPNQLLAETKIPDATPGIVAKYALTDEQALLAKVRYNRLVDIFLGITCYSLQNHLRTTAPNVGQVETDEIYIGLDKRGVHYVVPVQAKGRGERLGVVQIEQDLAVCAHKFPSLVCRQVSTLFMQDGVIVLFEFEIGEKGVAIVAERQYKLVAPEDLSDAELNMYRNRKADL